MKRFRLRRYVDHSGSSGIGFVAEGVEFSDGVCAMRWLTERRSTAVYDSLADLIAIHSHGGDTEVQWMDR